MFRVRAIAGSTLPMGVPSSLTQRNGVPLGVPSSLILMFSCKPDRINTPANEAASQEKRMSSESVIKERPKQCEMASEMRAPPTR